MYLWKDGGSQRGIVKQLVADGRRKYSKTGIRSVIVRYKTEGSIATKYGQTGKSTIPVPVRQRINDLLEENPERTSMDLHTYFQSLADVP